MEEEVFICSAPSGSFPETVKLNDSLFWSMAITVTSAVVFTFTFIIDGPLTIRGGKFSVRGSVQREIKCQPFAFLISGWQMLQWHISRTQHALSTDACFHFPFSQQKHLLVIFDSSSNFMATSTVLLPIDTSLVDAASNKQFMSPLQTALASLCSVLFLKTSSSRNIGSKVLLENMVTFVPGSYVNNVVLASTCPDGK